MEDWIKFNKQEIPKPLSGQSGGWFWIVQRSVYGNKISPAWWTGSKFDTYSMDIITEFKRMNFPDMPNAL